MDLFKALCETAGQENVFIDEPMNRHTTFRIGGPGRLFCYCGSGRTSRPDYKVMPGGKCSLLYYWKWKQSSCRR